MIKKRLLLITLLCIPSFNTQALWPFSNQTFREYAWFTAAGVGLTGFAYNWMMRKALQKRHDSHKKRFRNHELLTDSYKEALDALAYYREYVDIIESHTSQEEGALQLCNHLKSQYAQHQNLLAPFKKGVFERKHALKMRKKEFERHLIDWQESRKKALLSQQGPLLNTTYTLILTTLEGLTTHIPYIEGIIFMQDHADLLKEERDLAPHLSESDQLTHRLNILIRSKARIGERYPYRSYTKWLELYHEQVHSLKREIEQYTYYEFQYPVVSYILDMYTTLDTLKKLIKSSKEFETECMQYDSELLARARENNLKMQLSHLQSELDNLKQPAESQTK